MLIKHKLPVDKIQHYTGKRGMVFAKYATLIRLFRKESFESELLSGLKKRLFDYYRPEYQMKKLASLSDMLDNRLNMIFALVNVLILWDFHISLSIERWFKKNNEDVSEWLDIIGHVDAILSIGILHYNHKDWCFPEILDDGFQVRGKTVGHPLIPEKQRITNNYEISDAGKIDIITGSNMAGKSTFLRTIGVNMILAYIGAPVCAENFSTSVIDILSYFRIHDSLEESTSSFYAELKRIKDILERSEKEGCFILLDELLRGTNTSDRHKGSVAVIKQLIRNNATGMVATHDLAIADMKNEYPENIRNYHFDVSVKDEELFFDYKLKDGICQSFNATLLMKKIGIEL